MKPLPTKAVMKVYMIFSVCTIMAYEMSFHRTMRDSIGLVITIFIFGINLWGAFGIAKLVVETLKGTATSGLMQFLTGLKFFFFLTSILLIFLAFGWVSVLIGNSLAVISLLTTTAYFAVSLKEDSSNE